VLHATLVPEVVQSATATVRQTSDFFINSSDGVSIHTRVVERTLHRRGKSFTPESSVVIELSNSCSDDCSDVTEEDNEAAMVLVIIVVLTVIVVYKQSG
jgi:hypothetical protein